MVNIMKPEPHKILSVTHETQAEFTFRVAFDKPTHNGQFCMLSIPKVGEAPISISGKGDGYVEFTIRKVGRLTQGVFDLREGSTLFLRGPYGHWWPVEETFAGEDHHLLIISGGTGLAPVRTTLNYFYNNPDQIASLYLISGFKDVSGALFNEEREKWSKAEKFHTIYTLDASEAPGFETGMVTAHISKVPFDSFGDNYNVAIVGPPPMMHFSALECMKLGVPEDKIWVSFERKMSCAVGKCGHCKINETYVCLEGPVLHYPKARTLFD
ncbi:MAG: anaerobic sulfite reductase subunit AsrB [Parasporobacterium sp.]|nr:anaerobic sulfite reductase subunit AsrB [Lachnospiraceae bacterium]MBR2842140.1 anaerobic sulfite reductase subunit AsrB [Lachnospiraceae bacterium]MBR3262706.1 anaerobic sulfite reductase subunit AsrB [Lachnospiraceae bacterium]MBR3641977.1 anaerobic sulfite reductase subunit AsrB [Parasporobacterium sp.]MBR6357044.1 anaerobic sulfite reductase subunit AsrB [Lachnospiraceae bacterium]